MPKMLKKPSEYARDAATAHTDLNTFGTVISILEGGHLYRPRSGKLADRLIRLCRDEMQRCLEEYEEALENANG